GVSGRAGRDAVVGRGTAGPAGPGAGPVRGPGSWALGEGPPGGVAPRRAVVGGWSGRTEHAAVADDVDAAPVAGAAPHGRDQLVEDGQVGQEGAELDPPAGAPPARGAGGQRRLVQSL